LNAALLGELREVQVQATSLEVAYGPIALADVSLVGWNAGCSFPTK